MIHPAVLLLMASLSSASTDARKRAEALLAEDKNAEALNLLQRAVRQSPRDGQAWYQLARAVTAVHDGSEPQHPCDVKRAWPYVALHALNEAAKHKVDVKARLQESDPKLSPLKRRGEYRKWSDSREAPPKGDAAMAHFLRERFSWVKAKGDVVFMDLEPGGTMQRYTPTDDDRGDAEGTWRIGKGTIDIALRDGGGEHLTLAAGPFAWQLRGKDGVVWEVGPLLHDCDPGDN